MYSLDRHQQWNLDREEETRRFYGVVDAFLAAAERRGAERGVTVLVVSDHGHQRIEGSIDILAGLRELGLLGGYADGFA